MDGPDRWIPLAILCGALSTVMLAFGDWAALVRECRRSRGAARVGLVALLVFWSLAVLGFAWSGLALALAGRPGRLPWEG